MTGTITKIICSILLLTLIGCETPKETKKQPEGVSNIPNIVKALEAIGSVGKSKVDKEDKK